MTSPNHGACRSAGLLVLLALLLAGCGDDAKQTSAPKPERMYLSSEAVVPTGPHTLRLEAGASGSNQRFEVDLRPDGKGGAEAFAYAFLPADDQGISLDRRSLCLTVEVPEDIDPARVRLPRGAAGRTPADELAYVRKSLKAQPDRECPVTPVRVTSGR